MPQRAQSLLLLLLCNNVPLAPSPLLVHNGGIHTLWQPHTHWTAQCIAAHGMHCNAVGQRRRFCKLNKHMQCLVTGWHCKL